MKTRPGAWGLGPGVWKGLPWMIVLFRALTYSTLFIGLLLVFVPDRVLTRAGITRPPTIGMIQIAGMLVVVAGAALAIASILTFAFVGKGTPAPFDPPRRLVIAGPYRWVRNPMYIGAGLVLLGAAMFYGSIGLVLYTIAFWSAAHLFVLFYEEPVLRNKFGADYDAYLATRRRWMPRWRS